MPKVDESLCFKQVWRLRKKFNRSLSIAQKRYAVAIHFCRGGRGLQLLPVVLGLVRAVRRRGNLAARVRSCNTVELDRSDCEQ